MRKRCRAHTQLIDGWRMPLIQVPHARGDPSLTIEKQQMPAAFVFVCMMPTIGTQLMPLDCAVLKIDGAPSALDIAQHCPPFGRIDGDIAEGVTGSAHSRSDNEQPTLKCSDASFQ